MNIIKQNILFDFKYYCWRTLGLIRNRVIPSPTMIAFIRAIDYIHFGQVEGDVAEFGVWTGNTAKLLYSALRGRRTLYLFDSFEGLPELSNLDKKCQASLAGIWKKGAFKGSSMKSINKSCPGAIIYKGWYRDTVPQIDTKVRFAMIHIDCDLYSSTLEALEPLFSRCQISDGAILLFDDWNSNRASNSYGERAAWKTMVNKFNIDFEDNGTYGPMQKSIIVHSYNSSIIEI